MRVPIKDTQGLLHKIAPRPDLPLFVGNPRLPFPGGVVSPTGQPRRVSAYLFFFMIDGQSIHNLDMEEVHLTGGRVLFVQPNQIHQSTSGWSTWKDWYKIVFDEYCLALLPRSYHFLQDPFNSPLVTPGKEALARLGHSLEAMAGILFGPQPYSIDLALASAGPTYVGPWGKMSPAVFKKGLDGKLPGQINLVLIGQQYVNPQGLLHPHHRGPDPRTPARLRQRFRGQRRGGSLRPGGERAGNYHCWMITPICPSTSANSLAPQGRSVT